jgi:hypothetical protein
MAGQMELVFLRDTAPPKRKGPYYRLRFEGETVRAEAGGPALAKHDHHEWHVDGAPYSRLQIDCRASVHFERIDGSRSEPYGPYANVSFVDGIAYVEHEIFAFVDRSIRDWYSHENEQHWPLMVVEPAQ